MLIQPYRSEELKFAYCNRFYFRTHTYRRRHIDSLRMLTCGILSEHLEPYGLHLLEFASTPTDISGLLSLQPDESVSIALSKLKGRISKWIGLNHPMPKTTEKSLGKGYFAVTVGQPTTEAVNGYLEMQASHHGYADRARPPVWVQEFLQSNMDWIKLQTEHARTQLRYHLVLATQFRKGVFTDEAAKSLAKLWRGASKNYFIDKVSFLPDHVHVALSIHPIIAPGDAALTLMNTSQEFMWQTFPSLVIQAKIDRLWQSSAYIGSFGDLNSTAMTAYLRNWQDANDRM